MEYKLLNLLTEAPEISVTISVRCSRTKKWIRILKFSTLAIAGFLACAGSARADNEETNERSQKIAVEPIYQDKRQNAEDQVREENALPP